MQSADGHGWPEVLVFHPTRLESAQAIVIALRGMRTVVVHAGAMENASTCCYRLRSVSL